MGIKFDTKKFKDGIVKKKINLKIIPNKTNNDDRLKG
jgi:hypothetical protein